MIKRVFILLVIALTGYMLLPLSSGAGEDGQLSETAAAYVTGAPADLGAQNIVTAVIVTFRGLDTLGEVLVLFIATTGVGFLLQNKSGKSRRKPAREPSEILETGSILLTPLIILFGIYVFTHGHLTPGGGFQGGVIIATGFLLLMLARTDFRIDTALLTAVESVSGTGYLILGVLGLVLASGFLDSRLLPEGRFGSLISGGTIPLIYSFIGLKVGAELVSILDKLRGN